MRTVEKKLVEHNLKAFYAQLRRRPNGGKRYIVLPNMTIPFSPKKEIFS